LATTTHAAATTTTSVHAATTRLDSNPRIQVSPRHSS
jgi:hypothetical protein